MFKGKSIIISNYINKNVKTNTSILLSDELTRIKEGMFKTQVDRCRELLAKGLIAEYKSSKADLPVVTFSGEFNGSHKSEHIKNYTNLMVIDLDELESSKLIIKKKELFTDDHVLATWISPSNRGLKLLLKTDATIDTHKIYFGEICNYLALKYKVDADKSGSDICRLCFTSYDPQLLVKEDCIPFSVDLELITSKLLSNLRSSTLFSKTKITDSILDKKLFYATEGKNQKKDREMIDRIIRYLKVRDLSITGTYHDWYRVGLAIANTFTYDLGKKYYLYLCHLDGIAHDEYKSINILEYCYRNRKIKEINFATIIYLAEQKGFITRQRSPHADARVSNNQASLSEHRRRPTS